MLDVSQATFESLQEIRVVGAWIDELNATLHIACIGDRFDVTAIEIVTLDQTELILDIPSQQISDNRAREKRTIDYRLSLQLPYGIDPYSVYDNAVIRLCRDEARQSEFFPVSAIFTNSGRTMRCTEDRERAIIAMVESFCDLGDRGR